MTTETKRLDLDAIAARAEAATPGPWQREPNNIDRVETVERELTVATMERAQDADMKRDADFIAAARSDVPALVAEVRRLRGLVKRVEWAGYAEVSGGDEGVCPWCFVLKVEGVVSETHDRTDRHAVACPAFLPSGEVR